ncbi:COG1361 S-layer family protein [Natrinema sp. 74]|uniref:COG1361 S-layer family protein n=1 Tax=Natrinema sp. 74 TaxID=3384159 RepID=UPI0038D49121
MTGQAGGSSPKRPRRAVIAGCCVLVALSMVGSATAVSTIVDPPGAALQNDPFGNESGVRNSTAGESAGQRAPSNESPLEADAGPRAPTGGEPPATPGAGDIAAIQPIRQAAEANVTVAVADNQSVRASDAATVVLEVTNDGDRQATDIVVTLRTPAGALSFGSASPRATQSIYLKDIWPGDTESVDVDVAAAAVEPGRYPLYASVQYAVDEDDETDDDVNVTDGDGVTGGEDDEFDDDDDDDDETVVTGGPTALGIPVTDSRSLDVEPVTGEIPVDGTGVYAVQVTNDDAEPVTGVVAALNVSPPLSTESPTAYVGTLEAGESETVHFPLESSTDAIETTASAVIALSYDTGTGRRTTADPIPVPVSIVESDEEADVDAVAPFAAVAVVLILAAVWWLRRR